MNPGDTATTIGVGIALIVAQCAGIWQCASLRGSIQKEWKNRLPLAVASLKERTIFELRILRDQVDDLLPQSAATDPGLMTVDPKPLSDRASTTAMLYRTAQNMERDFVRLRKLGPILTWALMVSVLATALLTVHFAEVFGTDWFFVPSAVLASITILILGVGVIAYVLLQHRLATGEIRSQEGLR